MGSPAWIVASAAACVAVICGSLASGGCTAPRRPLIVTDPDPSVKIPAYKKAVRKKDRAAVKQLVADLDSDDPAVRFYAINALERLTGEQLGYRYYEHEEQRRPAVERWQGWMRAGEMASGGQ
jgi:hypothetical protein